MVSAAARDGCGDELSNLGSALEEEVIRLEIDAATAGASPSAGRVSLAPVRRGLAAVRSTPTSLSSTRVSVCIDDHVLIKSLHYACLRKTQTASASRCLQHHPLSLFLPLLVDFLRPFSLRLPKSGNAKHLRWSTRSAASWSFLNFDRWSLIHQYKSCHVAGGQAHYELTFWRRWNRVASRRKLQQKYTQRSYPVGRVSGNFDVTMIVLELLQSLELHSPLVNLQCGNRSTGIISHIRGRQHLCV